MLLLYSYDYTYLARRNQPKLLLFIIQTTLEYRRKDRLVGDWGVSRSALDGRRLQSRSNCDSVRVRVRNGKVEQRDWRLNCAGPLRCPVYVCVGMENLGLRGLLGLAGFLV